MTSFNKKSRKNLYGCIIENLETDSVKMLELLNNQPIKPQNDEEFGETNEMSDCHIPIYMLNKSNNAANNYNKIKQSKVIISHHNSKPKKDYFGSKTLTAKKNSKMFDLSNNFALLHCGQGKNFSKSNKPIPKKSMGSSITKNHKIIDIVNEYVYMSKSRRKK